MASSTAASDSRPVIFDKDYPGEPRSAGQARADLARTFRSGEILDDVLLIVSELISNAIVYSRSCGATLRLLISAPPVRISVFDHGPRDAQPDAPDNIDAPDIDAPDIDAPDIDAPDIDAPDIDVSDDVRDDDEHGRGMTIVGQVAARHARRSFRLHDQAGRLILGQEAWAELPSGRRLEVNDGAH